MGFWRSLKRSVGLADNLGTLKGLSDSAIFNRYGIEHLKYMTPIENLASIMELGLLSHNGVQSTGISRRDISDPEVQRIRGAKQVGGRELHDYVNLYFNSRNPMLYVRQEVQDNIAILCINRTYIGRSGVWYSDGNAASSGTNFYYSPRRLYELNWDCIWADYWSGHNDGTRVRCAEVLVPQRIPPDDIQQVVVRTNAASGRARQFIPDNIPVVVGPAWFF